MQRNILALSIAMFVFSSVAHADDVAALIEKRSQEFSDASASGDAATIGKYLDDRVIFMNEGGDIGDKKSIVEGTTPTPKNIDRKLTQSDFKVEVHGNVAVTSFTDNLVQQLYGQTLKIEYLSTEVWLKEGSDWKMISSQTMTMPDDPKTVSLPATTLDEYVGTYEATPAFKMRITREGDGLAGSTNDGKPYPIKAELRDVLVTPGQPTLRRIIQRDANGKVTGLISRRDGHDFVLKRAS
jgi:ketosteroid isomerase-like protein